MNASTASLEMLLERLRTGDLTAAQEVFTAYEPQLRILVRRRLGHRLRAKFDSIDVVQSVWVRVWQNVQAHGCHLSSPEHLRHFLARVALNCLNDRFRRYRPALEREQTLNQPFAVAALPSPEAKPSEVAEAEEVWEKLLALCPPEHHELLRLKRHGVSLRSIAARCGLHVGSVRRVLRKLARQVVFENTGSVRFAARATGMDHG